MSGHNPTTHITSLAALHRDFCIQMIPARELVKSLDASADLNSGQTMEEHFIPLLDRKEKNCSEWFRTNLVTLGIQEPLVIIVYPGNLWLLDNGHHRLAWGVLMDADVPVIFDDSGACDDSNLAYLVARKEIEVYHNTIDDDFTTTAEIALVEEVIEHLASIASIPRQIRGRHRRGGKHRLRK